MAFGAARAFPIRERYLLGHSDPLKGGPKQPCDLRVSQASAARERKITPAWAGPTFHRAPRVRVDCHQAAALRFPSRSSGGPGSPFGPRPLGTGAKRNKAATRVSNHTKALRHNSFGRSPQVAGGLATIEKIARVTNKKRHASARQEAALMTSVRWGMHHGWLPSAGSRPRAAPRHRGPSCPIRLSSSPHEEEPRRRDVTVSNSHDLVDVQLDAHDELPRTGGQCRAERRDRLAQGSRGAPVEKSIGLGVPMSP